MRNQTVKMLPNLFHHIEQHIEQIGDKEKYSDYIANRPRVEKFDTHGLFTVGEHSLILSQVAKEIADSGNVWTPYYFPSP